MAYVEIGKRRKWTILVDDADVPFVRTLRLSVQTNGYVRHTFPQPNRGKYRSALLHHLLIGKQPGREVDHINGNRSDNRRENLRFVTGTVNNGNRRVQKQRTSTGIRGIRFNPECSHNPWLVYISINDRTTYLGSFPTCDEAIAVRQAAELKHFGELCPVLPLQFEEWGGVDC